MFEILPKSLYLASYRYYIKHPWLLILTILGLASGVGIVTAVDIAVKSAQTQVNQTEATLLGNATHQILSGSTGVPQEILANLKVNLGIQSASPVIEGFVYANTENPSSIRLLGIDPFSELSFRNFVSSSLPNNASLEKFLTQRLGILLTRQTAQKFSVNKNETLTIYIGQQKKDLILLGFLPDDKMYDNLIVTDISNAQIIFDLKNKISRIDLILDDNDQLKRINSFLSDGTFVRSLTKNQSGFNQLTNAFRTNLTAMSLLALIIGMFVVFTTVRFSIYSRMSQFGLYRVIGVTGHELRKLIYMEVLVLGIIAGLIGLVSGAVLAKGLLSFVTQIFSDHYAEVQRSVLFFSLLDFVKVLFLSVGVTLFSAYFPASHVAKVQAIRLGSRVSQEFAIVKWFKYQLGGSGLCLIIGVLFFYNTETLTAAFAGLFLCVVGFSLLIPTLFLKLSSLISNYCENRFTLFVRMSFRDVRRSLSRTSSALLAMTIALSVTIGVALMVGSFRVAVIDWLDTTMRADAYVSLPDVMENPSTQRFSDLQLSQITALDNVEAISQGRHLYVNNASGKHRLMMVDLPPQGFEGFQFLKKTSDNLYDEFKHKNVVLITEPFAYHQKLVLGDKLKLNSPGGVKEFEIIGIYRDYASEIGKITISQTVFEKYWPNIGSTTVGLYLKNNSYSTEIVSQLSQLFLNNQLISIRSKNEIFEKSLAVFDRTFVITEILRILIVGVTVITVIVSLMSWQLERRRELAIAQAIGFSPIQLQLQLLFQSLFLATSAFIFAVPLGLFISAVLVNIINIRSFGWSMGLIIEPIHLFYAFVSAIIAAVISAVYPAWQIKNTSPKIAMQEN